MIKTDKKGNIVACITTKEDLDYSNFDKETIDYYDNFLIPSYEDEIERLHSIIKEVREYITSQKLHKFQDTTGGLTYEERKLLEILDKENKNE